MDSVVLSLRSRHLVAQLQIKLVKGVEERQSKQREDGEANREESEAVAAEPVHDGPLAGFFSLLNTLRGFGGVPTKPPQPMPESPKAEENDEEAKTPPQKVEPVRLPRSLV